jgi:hypothetical protein
MRTPTARSCRIRTPSPPERLSVRARGPGWRRCPARPRPRRSPGPRGRGRRWRRRGAAGPQRDERTLPSPRRACRGGWPSADVAEEGVVRIHGLGGSQFVGIVAGHPEPHGARHGSTRQAGKKPRRDMQPRNGVAEPCPQRGRGIEQQRSQLGRIAVKQKPRAAALEPTCGSGSQFEQCDGIEVRAAQADQRRRLDSRLSTPAHRPPAHRETHTRLRATRSA